jgi:hypothetical protein
MQSLVNGRSRQSALPCKVDYFNDKQMTDGARLARSARGKKDALKLPFCLGIDARRPRQRISMPYSDRV